MQHFHIIPCVNYLSSKVIPSLFEYYFAHANKKLEKDFVFFQLEKLAIIRSLFFDVCAVLLYNNTSNQIYSGFLGYWLSRFHHGIKRNYL